MAKTLVIVDMQTMFSSAKSAYIVYNTLKEIERAKQKRYGIVVVLYEKCGRLLSDIKRSLKNYDKVDYVTKYTDDGSPEVLDSIYSNGFHEKNILMCGVNIEACIKDTASGLAQLLPESMIEIIEEACNGMSDEYNIWSWVESYNNIILREVDYV